MTDTQIFQFSIFNFQFDPRSSWTFTAEAIQSTSVNDDLSLRYIVSTPSRQDDTASLPMVVMIHGRGADAHDLADLAGLLDTPEGCRFVFPNAPKPFEPYPGMAFGWTWFEGWPPQHESIVESRDILLRFIDEILARYPTPGGKLVLSGFSQGALMAVDAALRTEQKIAGIMALSGGVYEHDLPGLGALAGVPVLIAHGSADEVVPVNYARRARRILEDAGLPVTYEEYPMGHQIVQEEIELIRGFLARVVG
jgi:phospholipase/carboxylesterase